MIMIIIRNRLVLLETPATDATALRKAVRLLAEKSGINVTSDSAVTRWANNALAALGLSDVIEREYPHAPGEVPERHGGFNSVPKSMRRLATIGLWPDPLQHTIALWNADRDRLRLSTPDSVVEWYDQKQKATWEMNEFRNHRDAPARGLGFLGIMFVRMFLPHPEGVLATMNSEFANGPRGDATFDRLWPANLHVITNSDSMKTLKPALRTIKATSGQAEAINTAVAAATRRQKIAGVAETDLNTLRQRLEADEALLFTMLERCGP